MSVKEQLVAQDVDVRRRDYEDHTAYVADLGPGANASVDIVGDTVIVVDGQDQYELAVDGDAQAFNRNGIVTIEVRQ